MSSNLEFSGELPLFPSGWGSGSLAYTGGEAFWAEIDRVTSAGGFGDSLDAAMLGKAAPRVWLFLHEPGEAKLSTSAALAFARHLVGRGQAVLVLDGDDEDSNLTCWSGREHEEGWIDLVRYGVSLQTAGIPLPFGGRPSYLLGVGSFTPTDVTDGEIERVVGRLKRQADDVLVVAPTSVMGYKWAKVADLRLLCWDRAHCSEGAIDLVAGDFAGIGYPLTSLVGFGFPDKNSSVAMDGRTDLMYEETEDRPSHPVMDSVAFEAGQGVDEEFERISSELTSQVEDLEPENIDYQDEQEVFTPDVDEEPVWESNVGRETESVVASESSHDHYHEYAEPQPGKGSSKIFWAITVASVVLISMSSVFFYQYIRIPPEGNFAPVANIAGMGSAINPELNLERDKPIAEEVAEDVAQEVTREVTQEVEPAKETVTFTDKDMVPDSVREESVQVAESVVKPAAQKEEKQMTPVAVVASEIAPPKVDRRQGFQMDPYLIPVGEEGYALHIYSFADSVDALKQMRDLELRGFQTAWRAVEIAGKGRYYRVFLGSFTSKASARSAQTDLLEKLHQDWARVARF